MVIMCLSLVKKSKIYLPEENYLNKPIVQNLISTQSPNWFFIGST